MPRPDEVWPWNARLASSWRWAAMPLNLVFAFSRSRNIG